MTETYSLGPYKGELLLNLGGLFHVIKLIPPLPDESVLERAMQDRGIPCVVYMGGRACFLGETEALWCPTNPAWEEALLSKLGQTDPLTAVEIAEREVGLQILIASASGLEALQRELQGLETFLVQKLEQAQQRKKYHLVAEVANQLDVLQTIQSKRKELFESLEALVKQFGGEVRRAESRPKKAVRPTPAKVTKKGPIKGRGGTPQKTYRFPLLEVLRELGGNGKTIDVLHRVREHLKNQLVKEDLEYIVHGKKKEQVWMNRARWEIAALKEEGLIQSGGYGILILSDTGRKYLEEHLGRS